jgi:GntR family transcriptional regulator, galactonate operon transcriptional repressor
MVNYSGRGIHGMAVNRIGQQIIRGELAPGAILDPVELERELDVSRTVIREALRVLAAKGLVDARPNRGTFVRPREDWSLLDPDLLRWQFEDWPNSGFLANLAEVRAIVEPAGARLAAQRRNDADLAALRTALDSMAAANESGTADEIVRADLAFHHALLMATHNELLQRMELVIETGLRARDQLVHGRGSVPDSTPEHRAVFEAVAAGDFDKAEGAMHVLLEQAARDVAALNDLDGEGVAG